MGIPTAITNVLPILLAANWFPNGELATAFAIALSTNCVGGAFSGMILPYLLQNVKFYVQNMNVSSNAVNSISTINNTTLPPYIYDDERVKFMAWSGAFALIMFIQLVMTTMYCEDHPPTPPSAAQQEYRCIREARETGKEELKKETLSRLQDIKYLLMQKQFLLILLMISLKSSFYVVVILVPSFLVKTGKIDIITTGWLLTTLYIFAGFSSVLSGRILDKFKSSKSIFLICKYSLNYRTFECCRTSN